MSSRRPPVPPHLRALGPFGADLLRYAARQVEYSYSTDAAARYLRSLATQYDAQDQQQEDR